MPIMPQTDAWKEWLGLPESRLRVKARTAVDTGNDDDLWNLTEAWLRTKGKAGATVSPSTITNYKIGIRVLLSDWRERGDFDLLNPDPEAGQQWIRNLEARYKPGTVITKRTAARHLYAALRWADVTKADPFGDARVEADPIPPWEKRQPYTQDELDKLLAIVNDPYDRALLLLGAHAGLRAKECCQLKWDDVDLEQKRLVVQLGKGRTTRTLYFGSTLTDALLDVRPLIATGRFVLPYRSPASAWRHMKLLCLRADVPPKGVHSLRHTAATRLYGQMGALPTAQHLGHKSMSGIPTYAKWNENTYREGMKDW